jgi:hypothetical protein
MDNWQENLIDMLPLAMFMWACNMVRPILAPEIEERLRRKMTDGEWLYYLMVSYLKGEAERYQQAVKEWCQQLADLKVIHDFVWK